MVKQFDSAALRLMRTEMESALAAITAKHGVKFTIGKMLYTREGEHFHVKIEADIPTASGRKPISASEKALISMITGIPEQGMEDYKIIEKPSGTVWYITGYNSRAPKRPINIETADGRKANAPEAWVKRHLPVVNA